MVIMQVVLHVDVCKANPHSHAMARFLKYSLINGKLLEKKKFSTLLHDDIGSFTT